MSYKDDLKDPRWQKKRLEILERDGWKCRGCGDKTTTLHVHHQYYQHGSKPWEYPSCTLITLCEDCHESEPERISEAVDDLKNNMAQCGFTSDDWLTLNQIIYALSPLNNTRDILETLCMIITHQPGQLTEPFDKLNKNIKKAFGKYYSARSRMMSEERLTRSKRMSGES